MNVPPFLLECECATFKCPTSKSARQAIKAKYFHGRSQLFSNVSIPLLEVTLPPMVIALVDVKSTLTVGSKIIRALEIVRVKKHIPNAIF